LLKPKQMETSAKYWNLRNHQLFNQLEEEDINTLCVITAYKKAKKGEVIYFSHQDLDRLYILKEGRIKIAYYDENGTEMISEILMEGDIFGEVSLKKSTGSNHEFAQAISDEVSLCSFTLENFKEVLRKKPDLAITYSQMVGEKLRNINTKYSDLICKDVKERVLAFFKRNAQQDGKWKGERVEMNMYLTHQDIANYTASSRQTVSTIIGDLEKQGLIKYQGRKRVVIPNIHRL
jgi:CRP/FNR family transcriptional regulator, cyclic AMP receptor protein